MDDVVEQGRRDRWVPPRWLRGAALALAVSLAVLVVARPHLLSAGGPAPDGPPRAAQAARPANTSQGISIVVRQGGHLERYEAGSGRRQLAKLPPGLPDPLSLVYSPGPGGSGHLVGINDDTLFRTSPVRGQPVTPIAPAHRVLGVSPRLGRLFVLEPAAAHHRAPVAELDALTGKVTDRRPFPGYDGAPPWQPVEVVSLGERRALLLARPTDGGRLDLALAWDRVSVGVDAAPAFARIGSTSSVLGVADSHILTVQDRPDVCIDRGCPITVLTVTRGGVQIRTVQPPSGWVYRGPVAGTQSGDPIVVVSRIDDPAGLALARLFGGGRVGLLVAGTDGLVASVRPVAGSEGSVVFAVPRPEGMRLSVLLPGSGSAALLVDLPALEPGAELVCACR